MLEVIFQTCHHQRKPNVTLVSPGMDLNIEAVKIFSTKGNNLKGEEEAISTLISR
jgi:hypothetical protein